MTYDQPGEYIEGTILDAEEYTDAAMKKLNIKRK